MFNKSVTFSDLGGAVSRSCAVRRLGYQPGLLRLFLQVEYCILITPSCSYALIPSAQVPSLEDVAICSA